VGSSWEDIKEADHGSEEVDGNGNLFLTIF